MKRVDAFQTWLETSLFDNVVEQDGDQTRLTSARIAALFLASSWYLGTLLLLVITILAWQQNGFSLSAVFLTVTLGIQLLTLIPQFIELPPHEVVASPQQFPAINHLVMSIAELRGVTPPTVVLTERFDAAFGRIGPSRQPVLLLGHPLLSLLNSAELVALIAHEVGHSRDGALTRSVFVRLAQKSMRSWLKLLTPGNGWRNLHDLTPKQRLRICATGPISLPLTALVILFEFLCARDAVRAEYAADRFSLKVSGPVNVPELADKLRFGAVSQVRTAYSSATPTARYATLQHAVAQVSPLPDAPATKLTAGGLMAWHPPVQFRYQFAAKVTPAKARYALTAQQFSQIHQELAEWPVIIGRKERQSLAEDTAQSQSGQPAPQSVQQ